VHERESARERERERHIWIVFVVYSRNLEEVRHGPSCLAEDRPCLVDRPCQVDRPFQVDRPYRAGEGHRGPVNAQTQFKQICECVRERERAGDKERESVCV